MKNLHQVPDLSRYTNVWLLILRIGVSVMMLTHGIPKLNRILQGNFQFADPIGVGTSTSLVLAIFAEVGCSILISIGLITRLATIPPIITMLVAVFIQHAADPFGRKEVGLLYILIYLTILVFGPGKYSVDNLKK
jgi:putative oxidoreductase